MTKPARAIPQSIDETLEPARRGRLPRRPLARDRAVSRAAHGPAAVPRRRGGRRQDRDRQGAGDDARPPADPAAMLRGPRRLGRGLRVELRRADDRDPARRGRGQHRPRPALARRLLRALPDQAAAAAGARARHRRRAGAADRRARPHRRGVRGVPARGAGRLPGDDPRDRHRQGRASADRRHHLEPHARDPRRAEAALPLSLGRLSERRARARDRAHQGAGHRQAAVAGDRAFRAGAAQAGSVQGAGRRRDARLGERADRARRGRARSGDRVRHARRAAQVPGRHRPHRRRRRPRS